jgi:hypothetical protein
MRGLLVPRDCAVQRRIDSAQSPSPHGGLGASALDRKPGRAAVAGYVLLIGILVGPGQLWPLPPVATDTTDSVRRVVAWLAGPARRALLRSLPLQEAIAREYRGITISTIDMYVQHMMRDDAYAEDVEAAIAAKILGVELSIYVPSICSGWQCQAAQMGEAGGSPRAVALINRDQAWASHYQILRA